MLLDREPTGCEHVVLSLPIGLEIIVTVPYQGWTYTVARLNGKVLWSWVRPFVA